MLYLVFVVVAPIAAALCLGIMAYAWSQHHPRPAAPLAWCALAIAGWLIFNTAELLDPTPAGTLLWAKLTYLFIALASVAWLAFALAYTGWDQWLAPGRFWIFCIVPVVFSLLTLTNDYHHLIWQRYSLVPVSGLLAMWVDEYGPLFWLGVASNYSLVVMGAVLIGRVFLASHAIYRQQALWVMVGASLPLIANLLYVFRIIPGYRQDFSPIVWALGGLAFAIAILRHRLLDLMPVARQVLVDNMDDGVLVLDGQDRIVDLNPAARRILAIQADDVLGCPPGQMWSAWHEVSARMHSDPDTPFEIAQEQDGTLRTYDVKVSPLPSRQRPPLGHLIVLHDVTRRKEAEELLHRAVLDLQARNADLDAFAHTVAHDLESPLTVVNISMQLLLDLIATRETAGLRETAHVAARAASQASELVRSMLLLALSREIKASVQPVDMAAIVAQARERLALVIAECQPVLIEPASGDWPVALGHAPWLVEVWVNYLSNALKYGGRPPLIELGACPDPSGQLRFWVRDNGRGLSAEEQSRLFVPFERLDIMLGLGHGLGLSIVKRIVDKLGGEVGVESLPGQGSTFYFTLPRAT